MIFAIVHIWSVYLEVLLNLPFLYGYTQKNAIVNLTTNEE